jgi:hypothetical protein
MKSDKILSPNVRPNEDSSGSNDTLAEKHRLRKVILFSSVLKYFHPNKRRYDGDHATIFRTIHMITGGTLNIKLAGAATKIMSAQTRT